MITLSGVFAKRVIFDSYAPSRSTPIGGVVICASTLWIARREARGPR